MENLMSFEDFYKSMGLVRYPFWVRTAEKEEADKLFIKPINYPQLEDVVNNAHTAIICGNRGAGKTMLLSELKTKVSDDRLVCEIDNFEDVRLRENLQDYYSLILKQMTQSLVVFLSSRKKLIRKATKNDKLLLSFLIKKYGNNIVDSQLYEQLSKVQLNFVQRMVNVFTGPITAFLNYGTTAVTNFGNELLTKQFGAYLPDINCSTIKNIFPEIKFAVEDQFLMADISYSMLESVLAMIKRVTNTVPVVFIDRLDEDVRLENDAELVTAFIKDLLCDIKILHNSDVEMLISVWKIPFSNLSNAFRESKHTVFHVGWNASYLEGVLNKRLSVYSNNAIRDCNDLFADDVSDQDKAAIYRLSNENPRDLWNIYDKIFCAQYELDKRSTVLTHKAIKKGLRNFVSTFPFYEYYPRKKTAHRNTNDVYSYIGYLLKLSNKEEFTHDELRNQASTGGSTGNYITNMINIGLVKKTGRKKSGGAVIYQINDPKVSYAISQKIDIERP